MRHVICLIHRDHLTIERNGAAIGNVYELFGEPTIQLNNASNGQVVQLTQNDTEIIWDNWNFLLENRQKEDMQLHWPMGHLSECKDIFYDGVDDSWNISQCILVIHEIIDVMNDIY